MLDTVLRNLISNAIKFTPRNGKVSVSSKLNKQTNFIEISVKDTGIGISNKMKDELFRLDKHTSAYGTEGEKGTGLGLVLCKEFVEKHNGKIWVEDNEEQGSSIIFTMPIIT